MKMIVLLLTMLIIKLEAVTVNREQPVDSTVMPIDNSNWTTCEEFLEGSTFDEKRMLDVDWKQFYSWEMEYEDPYQMRFRLPTKMDVDRFKEVAEKRLGEVERPRNVSWDEPALFMESTIDLTAVFFRTGSPGKYQVVSSLIFEHSIDTQVIFGLKIVEPGYFAFLNCKFKFGGAFAPIDKMPKDDEVATAAALFKIKSPIGFAYKSQVKDQDVPYAVNTDDDVDDEEEMEVQMHGGSLLDY